MNSSREYHTATLFPDGRVLVAGGWGTNVLSSAETYNPSTGTWALVASMNSARHLHWSVLLPDGSVLLSGGLANGAMLTQSEVYGRDLGFDPDWQPVFSAPSPLYIGTPLVLTGSGFRGVSQASGGATNDSSTNYPLVQLRRVENGQIKWLMPDPANPFSDTSYTSLPVTGILPGPAVVTVFVNGIPGDPQIIKIGSSYTLQVSKSGTGRGTVTSSPAGIDCGDNCSHLFPDDTTVVLTATPEAGSYFAGWTGCDNITSDNACIVNMNAPRTVGAAFEQNPINYKAIIVAGSGPYFGNNLWDITQTLTNVAYEELLAQGFTDDKIYYLTFDEYADADNDGSVDYDGTPDNATLEYAITDWAADADSLVIYMMGHGVPGYYEINGYDTGMLSGQTFGQWLDTAQASIDGPVIVIYEACYAGSFVPLLVPAPAVSGKRRIVIASTDPT
jgi:hypothetical protein